jgi:hypothetical protein
MTNSVRSRVVGVTSESLDQRIRMTREQLAALEALITEYIATRDDSRRQEQFETDRAYAQWELTAFFEWLEKRPNDETNAQSR